MTPDDYLAMMVPAAQNVCPQNGLPWQVLVGQGALESGWFTYVIGQWNFLGRKWGGWGNYIETETQEDDGSGNLYTITAKFQDYDSLEQAIQDWCDLMNQEQVYVDALSGVDKSDPVAFIEAVAPVYATDTSYSDKIIQTMRACDLI
jgi:flagellum-specific peptidoglycan hydrolase FlgJ